MRSMIMVACLVTLVQEYERFFCPGTRSILKVLKRGSGQATCVSCVKVFSPVLLYARMHEL